VPTRRGWEAMLGALGVLLLGRILGLVQLYVVGAAGLILLGAAVGWVRLSPVKVDVTRQLRPRRVSAGDSFEVELCLTNTSTRRSPLMEVQDRFDGGTCEAGELRFLVAPMAPGRTGRTSYNLVTARRGVFAIGPPALEVRDPFGLAVRTSTVASSAPLTVLPRVERIAPPPRSTGGTAAAGVPRPPLPGQTGDSFYALREYAPGDDLRRVHWPSSARRDQLMIRQDDQPVQERTTVLLDLRAGTPETFETAVSAAASVVSAASGTLVRFADTGGHDSGYGAGPGHLAAILDRLAAIEAISQGPAGAVGRLLGAAPGGGTLVVVTSAVGTSAVGTSAVGTSAVGTSAIPSGFEMRTLGSLCPRFAAVLVIAVGGPVGRVGPVSKGGIRLIPVLPGQSFVRAWNEGLSQPRPVSSADRAKGSSRGSGA
jgi:uncharacterized protein (DUF58 family)